MGKRSVLAVIAVFIAWCAMDFVIHGVLLQPVYESTASMWRPMEEMNMPLMWGVTFIAAVAFVAIYSLLAGKKSLATGIKYGALFGLATGVSMGFGSYCYMPIPLTLAWGWFLGSVVEATVAGAIVGAMVKGTRGE